MACKKSCGALKIDVGKMSHRIAIQSPAQVSDGAGGYTEEWATVATVWASIEPNNSRERFISMQTETHTTHVIMCRYNPVITTAKRALFGSRVFDIVEVLNIEEANRLIKMRAVEGTL